MTEEFNLSEKKVFNHSSPKGNYYHYKEEDIKEFIKRLKEEVRKHLIDDYLDGDYSDGVIDKLAGDKLIE